VGRARCGAPAYRKTAAAAGGGWRRSSTRSSTTSTADKHGWQARLVSTAERRRKQTEVVNHNSSSAAVALRISHARWDEVVSAAARKCVSVSACRRVGVSACQHVSMSACQRVSTPGSSAVGAPSAVRFASRQCCKSHCRLQVPSDGGRARRAGTTLPLPLPHTCLDCEDPGWDCRGGSGLNDHSHQLTRLFETCLLFTDAASPLF
jgi:hypothetical protein